MLQVKTCLQVTQNGIQLWRIFTPLDMKWTQTADIFLITHSHVMQWFWYFMARWDFYQKSKKKSDPSTILNTLNHYKTYNDFVIMMEYKYNIYFTVKYAWKFLYWPLNSQLHLVNPKMVSYFCFGNSLFACKRVNYINFIHKKRELNFYSQVV